MTDVKKLVRIKELLDNAESALKVAQQLMSDAMGLNEGDKVGVSVYREKAATMTAPAPASSGTGKVIEGVFNGQGMVDKKGNSFPVPANYASKSKLIPGDVLKLTVTEEGRFLYKQIGPVERKTVVGPLVYNEGHYQVLGNGKAYNVLLASVTYFRAEVGDEITLIIPMGEESDWGAIEAVLPKFDEVEKSAPAEVAEKKPRKAKKEVNLEEELDI
jgi:protein involved in polysaccharide export with SLBB domain